MSNPAPNEPDPSTLARFREGDISALSTVFEAYGARVYRLARRMMGNQADAVDATQEIFVRAYEQARQFHAWSGLYTWLYRLAVRHCLNKIEQRKRGDVRARFAAARMPPATPASTPSPLERLILDEQAQLLDQALQSLAPNYRACLVLRELEGLSYARIAEHLEIPIGTVMSRLARARQTLRAALDGVLSGPRRSGIAPRSRLSKQERSDHELS